MSGGMKDDLARDKAMDRLVADKLRARFQVESRDCPDAETLAAYVEQTLSAGERQTWETHLVACRFCQDQVAELVRMSEEDELIEAEKPAPIPHKVKRFRWAWAGPALVALVVAGLWYTGEFRSLLRQQQPATVEAPAPPAPTPELQDKDLGPKAPTRRELAEPAPPEQEAPKPPSQPKSAPKISVYGSPGSRIEVGPGEGRGVGYGVGREADAAAIPQPTDERGDVAPAGAPPAVSDDLNRAANERYRADAGEKPSAAPPAPAGALGQIAKSEARDGGLSKEVSRADTSAKRASRQAAAAQRLEAASESGVELHGFAEDRRTWRVGRDGLIQKAAPDGTWETRASGVKADLFGISFATPAVGWAVGQSGTVLRTTDGGATWTRMPSPTTEDLVRVGAINEAKVNVITRSGQTLQSADGGRTWKPLRPE